MRRQRRFPDIPCIDYTTDPPTLFTPGNDPPLGPVPLHIPLNPPRRRPIVTQPPIVVANNEAPRCQNTSHGIPPPPYPDTVEASSSSRPSAMPNTTQNHVASTPSSASSTTASSNAAPSNVPPAPVQPPITSAPIFAQPGARVTHKLIVPMVEPTTSDPNRRGGILSTGPSISIDVVDGAKMLIPSINNPFATPIVRNSEVDVNSSIDVIINASRILNVRSQNLIALEAQKLRTKELELQRREKALIIKERAMRAQNPATGENDTPGPSSLISNESTSSTTSPQLISSSTSNLNGNSDGPNNVAQKYEFPSDLYLPGSTGINIRQVLPISVPPTSAPAPSSTNQTQIQQRSRLDVSTLLSSVNGSAPRTSQSNTINVNNGFSSRNHPILFPPNGVNGPIFPNQIVNSNVQDNSSATQVLPIHSDKNVSTQQNEQNFPSSGNNQFRFDFNEFLEQTEQLMNREITNNRLTEELASRTEKLNLREIGLNERERQLIIKEAELEKQKRVAQFTINGYTTVSALNVLKTPLNRVSSCTLW